MARFPITEEAEAPDEVAEVLVSFRTKMGFPDAPNFIKFALKCARSPQELDDADFERMRAHGLGDAELTELIAMSALAVYANTLADAIQVEPDPMFLD